MSEYASHYKHGVMQTAEKIERSSISTVPDTRTIPTRTSTRRPTGCTDLSLESF